MATKTKHEMLDELRRILSDALRLREAGGPHAKLTQAQGYIDGYMRALLDSGLATQPELLRLVSDVRSRVQGPATAELDSDVTAAA